MLGETGYYRFLAPYFLVSCVDDLPEIEDGAKKIVDLPRPLVTLLGCRTALQLQHLLHVSQNDQHKTENALPSNGK